MGIYGRQEIRYFESTKRRFFLMENEKKVEEEGTVAAAETNHHLDGFTWRKPTVTSSSESNTSLVTSHSKIES